MIYTMVPFAVTFLTLNLDFKVTGLSSTYCLCSWCAICLR